jgi:hypothetical protein
MKQVLFYIKITIDYLLQVFITCKYMFEQVKSFAKMTNITIEDKKLSKPIGYTRTKIKI